MALLLNLEAEEIRRDWLEATARDPRKFGLGIRILLELTQDEEFPTKVGDKTRDPLCSYRKYIHQVQTCTLATETLEHFIISLNSRANGVAPRTLIIKEEEPADEEEEFADTKEEVVKTEDTGESDVSTAELVPSETTSPRALLLSLLSEEGSAFCKTGKDSRYSPAKKALMEYGEYYLKDHSDEKAKIWDAATMRIKLAVEHLVTNEKYGFRTIPNRQEGFKILELKLDGAEDAYTRLVKLFNFFPTLEIMINSLENIISRACEGYTDLKYINIDGLSEVASLLKVAFKLNGGVDAVRQRRKDLVSLAYHRSTTAYVTKEAKEARHTKDQLNNSKEKYSELIDTHLIENLQMTAPQVAAKMDVAMKNDVPQWEVGRPPKVKTDAMKKKNVPNKTGLAYAAGAKPAKMCDTCKTIGRGETVYTSHNTEEHDPEKAKKFMAWKAERGKKKSAPAEEKKNAN